MANPAFSEKNLRSAFGTAGPGTLTPQTQTDRNQDLSWPGGGGPAEPIAPEGEMTVNGVVGKTLALVVVVFAAGMVTYTLGGVAPNLLTPALWTGLIGGLILAFLTIRKPARAPFTAPLYAVFEGLLLGAFSFIYEAQYGGIILQAFMLTSAITFTMLLLYVRGIIKVTERFRSTVMAATGAIFLVYMVSIVMSLFGAQIPFLHDSGPIGIGISVVILGVAGMNLALDFHAIEAGVAARAPESAEWYLSFGLLVTLVWVYLEALRLISKLRD